MCSSDLGSLVFAETVRPESKIKEIVIRSPEYTATLENDNDFWHIREADNYYANFDLVRSLFKNFRETRFIRKQTATPQLLSELDLGNPYRSDAHAGTSISILDEQGRELNHLILGKAGAENQTRFARIHPYGCRFGRRALQSVLPVFRPSLEAAGLWFPR